MRTAIVSCLSFLALFTSAPAAEFGFPDAQRFTPPPTFTWQGFYFGAHAGAVQADYDLTTGIAGGLTQSGGAFSIDDAAFAGGFQLGANLQTGQVVYGLEGDVQWMDVASMQRAAVPQFPSSITTVETNWAVSGRARVGAAFDRYLAYVTAGVAAAELEVGMIGLPGQHSENKTRVGWTAGAGIEADLMRNLSAALEYRFSDYGNERYNLGQGTVDGASVSAFSDVELQIHQFTLRLNYRFTGL